MGWWYILWVSLAKERHQVTCDMDGRYSGSCYVGTARPSVSGRVARLALSLGAESLQRRPVAS